jgi:SAM-dependent methyltransferase
MRDDRSRWEERYRAGKSPAAAAEPSSFLLEHADSIRGRVLDLACGAGRNALFLARRGSVVEAIDIALAGLQRLRHAALAEGLDVRPVQADLEGFPLPAGRYDAVINIRYLQRSLFPSMARALKRGGVLLFETFLIDQRQLGHPRNPDFLLQHGELRAAFSSLQLLHYSEGLVSDSAGDAYLARLVARAS